MPNPNWKKIKAEYISGGTSYRKLAQKYSVSFNTLTKRAKLENWTDLRKQKDEKFTTKIVETVAEREAKKNTTLQDTADALLQRIHEGVISGEFVIDTQSIKQITGALKDLQQIKGVKSELDMQEQIARIDKLRKEATVEDQNNEVRVVIQSELEDYSV